MNEVKPAKEPKSVDRQSADKTARTEEKAHPSPEIDQEGRLPRK